MNQPKESRRKKVIASIVLFWAVGVVVYRLNYVPDAETTQMYMYGQDFALLIAFLAGCWAVDFLFIRRL